MNIKLSGSALARQEQIMNYLTEFGLKCKDQTVILGQVMQEEKRPNGNLILGWAKSLPSSDESLTENPDSFGISEAFTFEFSPHAELQLLQRLKVPVSYFHRCPLNLQVSQLDHWLLHVYSKKEMTFRLVNDHYVRAALTKRYVPMDDLVVFPEILNSLSEARKDLHIRQFYKDNDFTLLRSVYTDLTVISPNDPTRHYWAGVEVRNSETGMSALWISPIVRSGRVETGIAYDFIDNNKEGGTRLLHVKPKEDRKTLDNAVKTALKTAQAAISHLIKMETEVVENPAQVLKDFAETTDHVPNRLIDILVSEYEHTLQTKKLVLAEAILNAVKDLPIFTKRMAEAEVGRYLHLFEDTDSRIDSIIETYVQITE